MKRITLLILTILTSGLFAQERPTLSLYSGNNLGGDKLDVFGEANFREKLEYLQNGSHGVKYYNDSALSQLPSIDQETTNISYWKFVLAQHTFYDDLLFPVKNNRASSASVASGHCAILADESFFGGDWKVLNPGEHNSFGDFNNKATSVATYKMIGKGQTKCSPQDDIPVLYEFKYLTGAIYPLTINNAASNASHLNDDEGYGYLSSGHIENGILEFLYPEIPYSLWHIVAGGYADKASALTVPQCYEVTLHRFDPEYNLVSKKFSAGRYNNLQDFDNNSISYSIKRTPNCEQEPVQQKIYPGSSCTESFKGNFWGHDTYDIICDSYGKVATKTVSYPWSYGSPGHSCNISSLETSKANFFLVNGSTCGNAEIWVKQ